MLQQSKISLKNKFLRVVWSVVWALFFRPSPRIFHLWRRLLLIAFGAKIAKGVNVYPSAKVWAPWNLSMDKKSCLGDYVNCYNVAPIKIGANSTVSQFSYLCTASHDYSNKNMELIVGPIVIGSDVWITADVFVGPGLKISNGAVILARSSVFNDIAEYMVAGGTPARPIKKRNFNN